MPLDTKRDTNGLLQTSFLKALQSSTDHFIFFGSIPAKNLFTNQCKVPSNFKKKLPSPKEYNNNNKLLNTILLQK